MDSLAETLVMMAFVELMTTPMAAFTQARYLLMILMRSLRRYGRATSRRSSSTCTPGARYSIRPRVPLLPLKTDRFFCNTHWRCEQATCAPHSSLMPLQKSTTRASATCSTQQTCLPLSIKLVPLCCLNHGAPARPTLRVWTVISGGPA